MIWITWCSGAGFRSLNCSCVIKSSACASPVGGGALCNLQVRVHLMGIWLCGHDIRSQFNYSAAVSHMLTGPFQVEVRYDRVRAAGTIGTTAGVLLARFQLVKLRLELLAWALSEELNEPQVSLRKTIQPARCSVTSHYKRALACCFPVPHTGDQAVFAIWLHHVALVIAATHRTFNFYCIDECAVAMSQRRHGRHVSLKRARGSSLRSYLLEPHVAQVAWLWPVACPTRL